MQKYKKNRDSKGKDVLKFCIFALLTESIYYMYKILKKADLADDTVLMEVQAPRISASALPGQFLIVKTHVRAERIPLTICD